MKLDVFNFNEAEVRVVDREGNPWFVAVDVCKVLELTNVTESTKSLDSSELSSVVLNSGDQGRRTLIISESGLYGLAFKSRKPQAAKFRLWVTSEVLPSIRKTGRYEVGAALPAAAAGVVDGVSVLAYIRSLKESWAMEKQIQFGLMVRRYCKAMGLVFVTEDEPGLGKVFVFPREMLEEVRRTFLRAAVLPDGDAVDFERLLAEVLRTRGAGQLTPAELKAVAIRLELFPKVIHHFAEPEELARGLSRLVSRFDGQVFPQGHVLKVKGGQRGRRYEVFQVAPEMGLAA